MKGLKPFKNDAFKPLGNGASLTEETNHFLHHHRNKLTCLMMRMEVINAHQETALKESREFLKKSRQYLKTSRKLIARSRKGLKRFASRNGRV